MVQQSALRYPENEKDGQEFGLVPKYVLRKKKKVNVDKGPGIACSNDNKGSMMKDCTEETYPKIYPEHFGILLTASEVGVWGLPPMK